jgi:uncharacterized repeat protein (TIGR02543 family)
MILHIWILLYNSRVIDKVFYRRIYMKKVLNKSAIAWFIILLLLIGQFAVWTNNNAEASETKNPGISLTEVPEGYIPITTPEDLHNIRNNLDGKYIIMNNIDLTDFSGWTPIGTMETPFTGMFDGNGYQITGLSINVTFQNPVEFQNDIGLFGYVMGGELNNIRIENSSILVSISNNNEDYEPLYTAISAGGLAGGISQGEIINSSFSGTVKLHTSNDFVFEKIYANSYIGGLVGRSYETEFSQVKNWGDINAETENRSGDSNIYAQDFVGGLVGYSDNNRFTFVENRGNISAKSSISLKDDSHYDARVGGIEGLGNHSAFSNAKNFGNVGASSSVRYHNLRTGGISGTSHDSTFLNNYNEGNITTQSSPLFEYPSYSQEGYAGGLAGYVSSSQITNGENSATISGRSAGGLVGIVNGSTEVQNGKNQGVIQGETAGGIAGNFNGSTLLLSSNAGEISGTYQSGGIVGDLYGSTVTTSYNNGLVNSRFNLGGSAGGIAGSGTYNSIISKSYNTGHIYGDTVGGIGGYFVDSTITDTFNKGILTVSKIGGGVLGRGENKVIISNSYNIGHIQDTEEDGKYSSGIIGGVISDLTPTKLLIKNSYYLDSTIKSKNDSFKKSFEELQQQVTYTGFDFSSIWSIDNHSVFKFPYISELPIPESTSTLSLHIETEPVKGTYRLGEELDISGLKLMIRKSNGEQFEVPVSSSMVSGFDKNQEGNQIIRVTYENGLFVMFEITVIPNFVVTFKDDGTILKTETVSEGDAATAPYVSPKEGKTFTRWDTDFSNITSDLYVQALYTTNEHTVTFMDDEGNVLSVQKLPYGSSAIPPIAPNKPGYTFWGWDHSYNYITSDLIITAKYDLIKYNVWFVDYDGNVLKHEQVAESSAATAPENPVRTGYTFSRWNTDFNNITSDTIITATYSINEYTVTFKDYNGRVLNTQTVLYGYSAAKPTNPVRTGYTFTGWDKSFNNITSNLTVTAKYTINKYTVTFKNETGSVLSTQNINYGASAITPKSLTKSGYTFIGWYKTLSSSTPFNFNTAINSNITLYGRFAKNTTTPSSVKAASIGYNRIKISWAKVSGALGYELYRATSSSGTYSKISTISSGSTLTFTNTNITTGKNYYYKIRAYRTVNGVKVYSSYSSVTNSKPVLATPTGVKALRASSSSIKISWNEGSEASGYEVYRATSKMGSYSKLATITSSSTITYINKSVTKGRTYYYKVRSYRMVSGKKIYSGYSAVVYAKAY